jgi:hypothetical protein
MEREGGSGMVQIAPVSFGLIIAYILPGAVTAYALRHFSPRVDSLWHAVESGTKVVGPLVVLATAALIAGLVVSSFRTIVLEPIFYRTGIQRAEIKYDKIASADNRELFKEMIENVYRFHQFYGNLAIAISFYVIARYAIAGAPVCDSKVSFSTFVVMLVGIATLTLAARKSLGDVCKAIGDLCR